MLDIKKDLIARAVSVASVVLIYSENIFEKVVVNALALYKLEMLSFFCVGILFKAFTPSLYRYFILLTITPAILYGMRWKMDPSAWALIYICPLVHPHFILLFLSVFRSLSLALVKLATKSGLLSQTCKLLFNVYKIFSQRQKQKCCTHLFTFVWT